MPEAAYEPTGLLGTQIFGLPIDREILFSNHRDIYKTRVEKRQRKLIVKISFLKPFLKKGEKVLLVTTGYSPLNSFAQYITGFVFVYLKRSLLVFTNYRIFHIPATSQYNYNNSISQVVYTGCESIVLKGGTFSIRYKRSDQRKNEKFRGIAGSERKKIRYLLKNRISFLGKKWRLSWRIHLCPRCTRYLAESKAMCPKCRLRFKSKGMAALCAILFPGGGYLYIRKYLLGFLVALLEIVLGFHIYYLIINTPSQVPLDSMLPVLLPVYLYLKIGAVIHSCHFTDDFIPKDKHIEVVPATE
ncbi:hypothetical protein D1AOALGA4SA_1697 [Olavius algarvensis Delta 1 endosymbiont]|nr:hypothetical protein D1AOALGA4SA_1697 [Olavius algarvensis Delta 1 endosymbiont]